MSQKLMQSPLKLTRCRVHRRHPATTRHFAQALLMTCPQRAFSRSGAVRRQKMSHVTLSRFSHSTFLKDESQRGKQTCNGRVAYKAPSILLRDDHIVLLTIDALLALHASLKRWRKRRRTLRALADLDERQLRDIGLTRDGPFFEAPTARLGGHKSYRTIAELDGN